MIVQTFTSETESFHPSPLIAFESLSSSIYRGSMKPRIVREAILKPILQHIDLLDICSIWILKLE